MNCRHFVFALSCALSVSWVSAAPLIVSESGIFGAGAPTTIFSAPNAGFAYSFQIDSTPAPLTSSLTHNFTAPFTAFSYKLNGNTVAAVPNFIEFFSAADGGGLLARFATADIAVFGAADYIGPESAPMIVPGVYPLDASTSHLFTIGNPNQPLTGNLLIASVPEPSTMALILLAAGVAAAIWLFHPFGLLLRAAASSRS